MTRSVGAMRGGGISRGGSSVSRDMEVRYHGMQLSHKDLNALRHGPKAVGTEGVKRKKEAWYLPGLVWVLS